MSVPQKNPTTKPTVAVQQGLIATLPSLSFSTDDSNVVNLVDIDDEIEILDNDESDDNCKADYHINQIKQ